MNGIAAFSHQNNPPHGPWRQMYVTCVGTYFTAVEIADSHELETPLFSLIDKFLIRSKEASDNSVLQGLVAWVIEEKRGRRNMTSFHNHFTYRCIVKTPSKSKEI